MHVDAPAEAAWDLVADVTRMGEWSPETTGARWLGGASGAVVGARFLGRNAQGRMRWVTLSVVEEAVRGRRFTFATYLRRGGKRYTRWRFVFEPTADGGCDVTESWELVNRFPLFTRFVLTPEREALMHEGMQQTLARVAAAAVRQSSTQ